ncbi:MAG TPA: universal stress protein [candidate division Zixibacteria bacterium]|nr:universal stress protein [candidate division Zixibacteria bacterium]
MYKRILIPLDGSKTAEQVLPYARYFALKLGIPVEFLGVVDLAALASSVSPDKARFLNTMIDAGVRASEEYLEKVAQGFSGVATRCTVRKGKAEDTIIEAAAADRDTLVAMATHGRTGLNRWVLGSVTEKVLRGASNPLLVIRAGEEGGVAEPALKSVLVPLDGSELAEGVLGTVVELARILDLEIILMRAYHVPANTYAGAEDYYAVNYEEVLASLRDEARDYLDKITQDLKARGVARVSSVVPEGYAADEIIALGRRLPDNLIAMCTHGRSGVRRWVLGSVTERVVRHSGDPVLVLRAKG